MVTVSAFMLIACATAFLFRGYQIRYGSRYDLIISLRSRELKDPVAWCRILGMLKLLLGAGFLFVALAALAYPGMSRQIAAIFCAALFLCWGPALTALERHERV